MPSAAHLRLQIEAALADRIPSALTPPPRVIRPTAPTGIAALDDALQGGLPIGAITELTGPECSGRTSLALSFLACQTNDNRVCAWVDVSDTLHPESAAAAGIDLNRLLWIRCGPEVVQLPLPGMSDKTQPDPQLARSTEPGARRPAPAPPIRHDYLAPRCCEPVPKVRRRNREALPVVGDMGKLRSEPCALSAASQNSKPQTLNSAPRRPCKPYSRLDQALRATDLLLQGGGFSAIVLDLGSIAPEFALRVPLATWFRYRAAAERTHASVLLLTQHPCSKSSAGLVLHCQPSQVDPEATTVFTGAEHRIEIKRDRFASTQRGRLRPPQAAPKRPHHPLEYAHALVDSQPNENRPSMTLPPLYACLYVREFPAQAMLRLRPNLKNIPVVILEGTPPRQTICSCNARARDIGIETGLTRAELDVFPGVTTSRVPSPKNPAPTPLFSSAPADSRPVSNV